MSCGKKKISVIKNCVFGLPCWEMDVVKKIKEGVKLFLYDFDLKLLYGYRRLHLRRALLGAVCLRRDVSAQVKKLISMFRPNPAIQMAPPPPPHPNPPQALGYQFQPMSLVPPQDPYAGTVFDSFAPAQRPQDASVSNNAGTPLQASPQDSYVAHSPL
ncbi:hypothetical protein GIB67_022874 [Kingdonia uniflora]|uniref:DCD domain-containing protein n=1 Tax=Kingdonia uniflora TaxID=39325 RepID=A0A7J7LB68_9MAGN|nr:hypothetical protein GIB67_022874 [Kingdonia uniflora]